MKEVKWCAQDDLFVEINYNGLNDISTLEQL